MTAITNDPSASPISPPTQAKNRWVWIVLAVSILAGGAGAWWSMTRTYHFAEVQPGVLYRAGNQNFDIFSHALVHGHVRTIVSLIDDHELADPNKPQFASENTYAFDANIRIERIPVLLGGWPTTADVQKFLDVATDKNNQPVIVHCAQGVRRTGMMVAAYQMSVLGYDKAKATAAIEGFGHSDRTIADVKKFIEIYDPATRTVTQQMSQSSE